MLSAFRIGLRTCIGFLCCAIVLACAPSANAEPKPLSKEEQAKVDAAIDKGVEFLKRSQTKAGDFLYRAYPDAFQVGQCALPAYALLEAGVPSDDPVIKKAADYIRPRLRSTLNTYELSLAILFLDRLGDPRDKKLIQALALRLIAGQHQSGGWGYNCLPVSELSEQELLKYLGALEKKMDGKEPSRNRALEEVQAPAALRTLTVFQHDNELAWAEDQKHPGYLTGLTDNSNTQFALLGLWAAQRHDVPCKATFEIIVERFERSQAYPSGHWGYRIDREQVASSRRSMICVGLLGLGIGRGLQFSTPGSAAHVGEDIHLLKGFAALGRYVGAPTGNMDKRLQLPDLYYLWSLERVGVLYGLETIDGKDWYRWGTERLLTNQLKQGRWPGALPMAKNAIAKGDYGTMLNTSFALLFLKRSHPMKELTPKLPFTAKELNEAVARLRPDDKFPIRPIAPSSPSRSRQQTPTSSGDKKNP